MLLIIPHTADVLFYHKRAVHVYISLVREFKLAAKYVIRCDLYGM